MSSSTENINLDTFAKRLETLMMERGLTQERLADALNAGQSTISSWLKGNTPGRRGLSQLANYFGVTIQWLQSGGERTSIKNTRTDIMKDAPMDPSSLYSHLSIEALEKNLHDLSAKLPSLPEHERKYILGNIRAILDELEQREMIKKAVDEIKEPTVVYGRKKKSLWNSF